MELKADGALVRQGHLRITGAPSSLVGTGSGSLASGHLRITGAPSSLVGTGPGSLASGHLRITGAPSSLVGTGPGSLASGHLRITGAPSSLVGTGPGSLASGHLRITGAPSSLAGTGPGSLASGPQSSCGEGRARSTHPFSFYSFWPLRSAGRSPPLSLWHCPQSLLICSVPIAPLACPQSPRASLQVAHVSSCLPSQVLGHLTHICLHPPHPCSPGSPHCLCWSQLPCTLPTHDMLQGE